MPLERKAQPEVLLSPVRQANRRRAVVTVKTLSSTSFKIDFFYVCIISSVPRSIFSELGRTRSDLFRDLGYKRTYLLDWCLDIPEGRPPT
ncbi:UNVERIFIED_CONTAM: hypothetical protein HHA_233925 [Hammondia hammondi]|eukprot:XP_008882727.1 hypothetical protein HHA_233925 [Hammondia hammondi]